MSPANIRIVGGGRGILSNSTITRLDKLKIVLFGDEYFICPLLDYLMF